MTKLYSAVIILLIVISVARGNIFAQEPPAVLISPAKATMLVGDTHTFRAVGKDGRILHKVRWNVSPEDAATLTIEDDEATLQAKEPSPNIVLTAYADGSSGKATIEIRSGPLTPGTILWSIPPIPGCKNRKITQAVPTANGPDLYIQEDCPQGTLIRALTADGREIWRRLLNGSEGISPMPAKEVPQLVEHLRLNRTSLCDSVFPGMTKEKVAKLVDGLSLNLEERQRQSDNWTLEEKGIQCMVQFESHTGTVIKKKKIIVTD